MIVLIVTFGELNNIPVLKESTQVIIQFMPFIAGVGILMRILSSWVESTDELPSMDFNRLKFWEWQLRYYIPFYLITIVLTHIINRGLGFIISIILSIVTIVKMIRVKKGGV